MIRIIRSSVGCLWLPSNWAQLYKIQLMYDRKCVYISCCLTSLNVPHAIIFYSSDRSLFFMIKAQRGVVGQFSGEISIKNHSLYYSWKLCFTLGNVTFTCLWWYFKREILGAAHVHSTSNMYRYFQCWWQFSTINARRSWIMAENCCLPPSSVVPLTLVRSSVFFMPCGI